MIAYRRATYDERRVFGTCPVCQAVQGEPCKFMCPHFGPCGICGTPDKGPCLLDEPGTHIARLINAPNFIVISEDPINV
jgi:hypothetical protein